MPEKIVYLVKIRLNISVPHKFHHHHDLSFPFLQSQNFKNSRQQFIGFRSLTYNMCKNNIIYNIQWNLSIADMLYSGHLYSRHHFQEGSQYIRIDSQKERMIGRYFLDTHQPSFPPNTHSSTFCFGQLLYGLNATYIENFFYNT